jgi:hypothetical protein
MNLRVVADGSAIEVKLAVGGGNTVGHARTKIGLELASVGGDVDVPGLRLFVGAGGEGQTAP